MICYPFCQLQIEISNSNPDDFENLSHRRYGKNSVAEALEATHENLIHWRDGNNGG